MADQQPQYAPPPAQPQYAPPPPEMQQQFASPPPQPQMGYPPGAAVPMAQMPPQPQQPYAATASPMMMAPAGYPQQPQQVVYVAAAPQQAAEGMCEICKTKPGALRCDRCTKLMCTSCDMPMRVNNDDEGRHHRGPDYMHYCPDCYKKKKHTRKVLFIAIGSLVAVIVLVAVLTAVF